MAASILANRLAGPEAQGLLTKAMAANNKPRFTCHLTEKGVAVVPILIELILWGAKHCPTIVAVGLLAERQTDKEAAVAKYQRLAHQASA